MPRILYSVSQNAFKPYEPVPVDSSNLTLMLRTLYRDEPYYLYDVNSKYKAQLSALIDGVMSHAN